MRMCGVWLMLNERDSALFSHMTRAISKKLGGKPEDTESAVATARSKLAKYGYIRSEKDKRLTAKGRARSREHRKESGHSKKEKEYNQLLRQRYNSKRDGEFRWNKVKYKPRDRMGQMESVINRIDDLVNEISEYMRECDDHDFSLALLAGSLVETADELAIKSTALEESDAPARRSFKKGAILIQGAAAQTYVPIGASQVWDWIAFRMISGLGPMDNPMVEILAIGTYMPLESKVKMGGNPRSILLGEGTVVGAKGKLISDNQWLAQSIKMGNVVPLKDAPLAIKKAVRG